MTVALALTGVAAAPAGAATLQADYSSGTLGYRAGAGEANVLTIETFSGIYRVEDRGVPAVSLAGDAQCTVMEPWKYKCPKPGLARAAVSLGDGADSADLSGLDLPATVQAGSGPKTISTGSGDDTIYAANGAADTIACGAGEDTVVADPQDSTAGDCEHVKTVGQGTVGDGNGAADPDAGSGDGSSSGRPGGASAFPLEAPDIALPPNPVSQPDPKTAVVSLSCAADAADDCRGEVLITLPVRARRAGSRGRLVAARGHYLVQERRIGRRKFQVQRGKTADVPVTIAYRGHYVLATKRRRARATLSVVQRNRAGQVLGVTRRQIVLHGASRKWSRRPVRR